MPEVPKEVEQRGNQAVSMVWETRVGQFWRQRPNRAGKIKPSALFLLYYAHLVMAGW